MAGAAWALVPAMLRAYLGVSEVINTIMFNFLASLFASYLLTTATFKDPGSVPQTPEIASAANLHELAAYLPEGSVRASVAATQLNTGFVVALFFAAVVAFILWKTTLGFELRAVGANATAASTQGIPVTRTLILVMCLSGALAGLGGAEQVLGVHHHFVKDFWQGLGFTGIAVALVGRNHPLGVVLAAMLFGALQNGAVEIDMMTLFPRELILVLQALIIFLVTSGPVLKEKIFRRIR
jgi:simple sugar transport system permease protein